MVPTTRRNHDGDMNETLNDAGQVPGSNPGHPGSNQGPAPQPPIHQDLDRLRRSTTNRYIAGVAGGLGRHFNIDPTIIRVLLVVLSFFGGAGVLIYAVCWLFVPEDTAAHAKIRVGSEPRKILLLAAAGIAFLLALGDAFNGFDAGWPIVSIAVLVAVVLIIRDRRHGNSQSDAPTAAPGATTTGAYAPTPAYTQPSQGAEQTAVLNPTSVQPPWQPPVVRPPLVSPHPKRTGILWFWPTIALIAVGLGILGIYDNQSHDVVDGAYPALAVGITGVMLLVGAFWGRAGGLIVIGLLASLALAGATAAQDIDGSDITRRPLQAADVPASLDTNAGEVILDLRAVQDLAALDGRSVDIEADVGRIEVIVPAGLSVSVEADIDGPGHIELFGDERGGIGISDSARDDAGTGTPEIDLELDVQVGEIQVHQQEDFR